MSSSTDPDTLRPDADTGRDGVTVVLATRDRCAALRRTFGSVRSLREVAEIIVIDDGSSDGTANWLARVEDPRLRVVREPQPRGSAAARNRGATLADTEWVLFTTDECLLPPDYARILRDDAVRLTADLVGAAPAGTDATDAGVPTAEPTPMLTGPLLVRRSVVLDVGYDAQYVTGRRAEVDFSLRAGAAGIRCVRTGRTHYRQAGPFPGGLQPGLLTGYQGARDNWRFLRRHGDWLAANGHIQSPLREQATFVRTGLRRLSHQRPTP